MKRSDAPRSLQWEREVKGGLTLNKVYDAIA